MPRKNRHTTAAAVAEPQTEVGTDFESILAAAEEFNDATAPVDEPQTEVNGEVMPEELAAYSDAAAEDIVWQESEDSADAALAAFNGAADEPPSEEPASEPEVEVEESAEPVADPIASILGANVTPDALAALAQALAPAVAAMVAAAQPAAPVATPTPAARASASPPAGPRADTPLFAIGSKVRVEGGPHHGKTGVIKHAMASGNRRYIVFDNPVSDRPTDIASWLSPSRIVVLEEGTGRSLPRTYARNEEGEVVHIATGTPAAAVQTQTRASRAGGVTLASILTWLKSADGSELEALSLELEAESAGRRTVTVASEPPAAAAEEPPAAPTEEPATESEEVQEETAADTAAE